MPELHPSMTGLESRFDEEMDAVAHGAFERDDLLPDLVMPEKHEASHHETEPAPTAAEKRTEEVMILGQ